MLENKNSINFDAVFKKLPDEIKDAIVSVDTSKALRAIGERHNLHIDKMGELSDEAGLVMMGITHPNDFVKNLTQRLGVSEEKANEIAKEVNDKIFLKIRESIKKIHTREKQEKSEEKTPEATELQERPPAPSGSSEQPERKESAAPANLPTGDISALKLGGMFKMEQEEQESKDLVNERPGAGRSKSYESDPYREPVE